MDVNEEHVQTLLNMGFPSENEIRRALRLGKNDLNEAVGILTNEHPSSNYDTLDDLDVEMKDVEPRGTSAPADPVYGPAPPPSYEQVVDHQDMSQQSPVRQPDTPLFYSALFHLEMHYRYSQLITQYQKQHH